MKQKSKLTSFSLLFLAAALLVVLIYTLFFDIPASYSATQETGIFTSAEPATAPASVTPPTPAEDLARQQIAAFARKHSIDPSEYPESLILLLSRNSEAADFVLNYPLEKDLAHTVDMTEYENGSGVPLFLQWDRRWGYIPYGNDVAGINGCGPVCLSMAAYYLTGDAEMSPDKIIEFAKAEGYCTEEDGSTWTLVSEGAGKLGLEAVELPLSYDRIAANLEVNNPIICVVGPGDFTSSGHFIVLTGMEDGKLRVNDPNSVANSQALWDYDTLYGQILNLWALRTP